MILTTIYRPTSLLAEYVQCFYFNESEDFEYEGLAEPSIYQELFFNFGDKFELRNAEGQTTYSRSWLSGIRSKALKVHTSGKHLSAGVIFKPWGLYAAFQVDARRICNANMVQEDVLKLDSDFAPSEISANAFFDFIEEALIKSLKKSRLTATMQGIIKGLEQEHLRTFSEKLQRSPKTIIQAFNTMIGLSPQKFYMLKCICESIAFLKDNPKTKLTELAYAQGFYDQAHFIRAFKAHTGLSPREFISKNVLR